MWLLLLGNTWYKCSLILVNLSKLIDIYQFGGGEETNLKFTSGNSVSMHITMELMTGLESGSWWVLCLFKAAWQGMCIYFASLLDGFQSSPI